MATTEVGNENERLQQAKAGTATMERESGASYQAGWTCLVARLIGLSVGQDTRRLLDFEHKPTLSEAISHKAGAAAGV